MNNVDFMPNPNEMNTQSAFIRTNLSGAAAVKVIACCTQTKDDGRCIKFTAGFRQPLLINALPIEMYVHNMKVMVQIVCMDIDQYSV